MKIIPILLILISCSTSPTGRKQLQLMSESTMDQMGVQGFEDIKKSTKIEKDPAANHYVQCVANAVIRVSPYHDKKWEVVLFDDPQVNAFAIPGEKIGVYKGLLKVANTQDQLAAVLGHEVGHVLAHHGNERVSQGIVAQIGMTAAQVALSQKGGKNYQLLMAATGLAVQYGVLLPFSRTHESEADVIGLDLMSKAGFDPRASVKLWENMSKNTGSGPPQWLSTHPSHETRMKNLNAHMAAALSNYQKTKNHPHCGSSPKI